MMAAPDTAEVSALMKARQQAALAVVGKEGVGSSLLGTMGGLLNFFFGMGIFIIPFFGGAMGRLAQFKFLSKVAPRLEAVHKVASLPHAKLLELPKAVEAAFGKESKICNAIHGVCTQTSTHAQKVLRPGMVERLSQASLDNTVCSLGAIGGGAANTAYSLWNRGHILKQMEKDLAANVSPEVLRGNDVLKQARREVRGWRSVAGAGLGVAGILGNVYMMTLTKLTGIKFFLATAAIPMGTGALASVLTQSDAALQSYRGLYESFARTGRAPVEAYAGVIAGLAPNENEQKVMEFAQKLCEKQALPGEVLKFLAETSFFKQQNGWVMKEQARRAAATHRQQPANRAAPAIA